jgi:hypothetical protein
MDPAAGLLEQVHQPVPAEGGFDHHLRVGPCRSHRLHDLDGVVGDADGGEVVAVSVHPHDHRAAPVQVDADILSFGHVGSSLS